MDKLEIRQDMSTLGQVLALPTDHGAYYGLRLAAKSRNVHVATFIWPFAARDLSRRDTLGDRTVDVLTRWIIDQETNVDAIVSPARLSRSPRHARVGVLVMRAAIAAAEELKSPLVVLEGRGIPGERGNWVAASEAYPDLVMPASVEANTSFSNGEALWPTSTTYTRHTIMSEGMLPGGSHEALVAVGAL